MDVVVEDVVNNLRFPGQYYDSETGLHYNWHRFYDSETGRYVSADPIGLAGGMNLYSYANQNPINYIDPMGLDAWLGEYVEVDNFYFLGGWSDIEGRLDNLSTGQTCTYKAKCKKLGVGLMIFDVSGSSNLIMNGPKCGESFQGGGLPNTSSVGAGLDVGDLAFALNTDKNGIISGAFGVGGDKKDRLPTSKLKKKILSKIPDVALNAFVCDTYEVTCSEQCCEE